MLRTGAVSDALLPGLMRRACLLALPSLVEGFGLVALEALGLERPCWSRSVHRSPNI